MNINNDPDLVNAFGLPPARGLETVTEVVIHHTAGGGSWQGLKGWILGKYNERIKQHKKFIGLTHFYIDRDGKVNQPFPLTTWLYHSCSGKHDKVTVGIELVHEKGDFTDAQYKAVSDLVWYIEGQCPVKTVVSHDYNYLKYSKASKGCPGPDFKWDRLELSNNVEVHA